MKMDAVTYPQPHVQEFLAGHTAFAHANFREPSTFVELFDRTPVMWTPTFLLTDHAGRHMRRWFGYLPPEDLLAEVRLGLALQHIHRRRPVEALDILAPVLDSDLRSTPEALYWAGVADLYGANGDKSALLPRWDELMARFPDSSWATRADCLESLRG